MNATNHIDHDAPLLERLLFNNRPIVLLLFLLVSGFLGYQMTKVQPDVKFEKLIPLAHPYIQNSMAMAPPGGRAGNTIKVAVAVKDGDIFTREYLEQLRQISDALFYMDGVDRGNLVSMWTPALRWQANTPEGWKGDAIIGPGYDGSPEAVEQIRTNVLRSRHIGTYVANDFKSSVITVPLLALEPGESFDYQAFATQIEQDIREKFQNENLSIHVVGFPKWIADLLDGFASILAFFAGALGITLVLLYFYSRCWKSSIVPLVCSVIAVVWQLGLLNLFGFGLDPYSVLVPFLVFAIGVSHGVQIINAIAHEATRGEDRLHAARRSFRHLYIPGMLALVSDAIGFMTLYIIPIQVIQELAVTASIGVAVIIFTNLVLLPVLMSYIGVTKASVQHAQAKVNQDTPVWNALSRFAGGKLAPVTILLGAVLLGGGLYFQQGLQIGDLDAGQPMLRPDSRYNKDVAFVNGAYSTSSDTLVVFMKTEPERCTTYDYVALMDRLMWSLENDPGVQSTYSMVTKAKYYSLATNEANPPWYLITRDPRLLTTHIGTDGMNGNCSVGYLQASLYDHKAATLDRVTGVVEEFAAEHNSDEVQFLLGGGNAGIDAATNQEIERSQNRMLGLVYGVVSFLCLLTFRSWRAVICIVTPLGLTSILCQALMAQMGIGIKVATLPVIALGVGIGVDYGIYIFSRLESFLREGRELVDAYLQTLRTTGKAVVFTGFTLAIGVGTWVFSPIKFQADMGILLTFMFLWNMVGAIWLLPALAHYLVKPEKYAALGPKP